MLQCNSPAGATRAVKQHGEICVLEIRWSGRRSSFKRSRFLITALICIDWYFQRKVSTAHDHPFIINSSEKQSGVDVGRTLIPSLWLFLFIFAAIRSAADRWVLLFRKDRCDFVFHLIALIFVLIIGFVILKWKLCLLLHSAVSVFFSLKWSALA